MERRYQVFVSSTFVDLQEEREAVVEALLELDSIPAGMELFPAANEEAWDLIKRVINESDYYVLVIGGRYGSVDEETQLGYTEKEYDYAIAQGKPVLAFLHRNPATIPQGKAERSEEAQAKLAAFEAKVKNEKLVKYWDGAEDLAGKVSRSFAKARQTYPAVGWVRGDVQASTESLGEINELRKQVSNLESQLASARTSPPPGVGHLAQGSDEVAFEIRYKTGASTAEDASTWSGVIDARLTWDDLFAGIGPYLLDEAGQRALRNELTRWLTSRYGRAARREVRSAIEQKGEAVSSFYNTEVTLTSDDFNTLLLQLKVLGLITKSDRKRSVSDKGTYWTLTPYGEEHLTSLRAITRGHDENDGSEEAEAGSER